MLHFKLERPFGSILALDACELPDFAVLIGRNGVGKSQVLAGIAGRQIRGSFYEPDAIEMHDIESFRIRSSERARYGTSLFAERTAQRFFGGNDGQSLSELAHDIFENTTKLYGLAPEKDGWQEFQEVLCTSHVGPPNFHRVSTTEVSFSRSGLDRVENAIKHYTEEIAERVVTPLAPNREEKKTSGRRQGQRPDSCNNDPSILVSLAMKLAGKLAHEIERNDILRAVHYEGDTISNTLSATFARYKAEQYSWAITECEYGRGDVGSLIDLFRSENTPPWETFREVLANMRHAAGGAGVFDFEFTDPEADRLNHAEHMQYSFVTQMTDWATGASYEVENLSTGEAIFMTLCVAWFNQSMGRKLPALLLLDEVDAMLHPSMVGALLSCLKELYVRHGTKVIMASHCPATVALLEEGEIFRVSRDGGTVRIRPVTRVEAVEELSDGIATLDTGLRIATADEKPVTIVTEGQNALILKRWAALQFPDEVSVFDKLPHRTGASDLKSYARILSKMELSSQLLFVWDCDQAGKIDKLVSEIEPDTWVTTHVLSRGDNEIVDRGIENKFSEDVLKIYAEETKDLATRKTLRVTLRKDRKTEFAKHIAQQGTKEDFEHFQDLHDIVSETLAKERKKRLGSSVHANETSVSGDGT